MLPLDPIFARLLIVSKDYHCTSEVSLLLVREV